jgi:hypothetical protein
VDLRTIAGRRRDRRDGFGQQTLARKFAGARPGIRSCAAGAGRSVHAPHASASCPARTGAGCRSGACGGAGAACRRPCAECANLGMHDEWSEDVL